MKFIAEGESPSGKSRFTMLATRAEIEVIHGFCVTALNHMPKATCTLQALTHIKRIKHASARALKGITE